MAADDEDQTGQPDIRSLRAAAEGRAAAEAEATALRRELQFAKAGIDTESKLGKMLFRTWEGESLDELKAEAREIGLLGNSTPQQTNDDASGQEQFRRDLSAGAPSGAYTPPDIDPREAAISGYHEAVKRGARPEDAALAAFDQIWTSAIAGDQRVLVTDGWRDDFRN